MNDHELLRYSKQIMLPQIDVFLDNGYTKEEMKMVWETKKIFEDDAILVNPTAVRVPVIYGHSEAIHIETRDQISADEVTELLKNAPGVVVLDERKDGGYPTAVSEASGEDPVYVGRIRDDISRHLLRPPIAFPAMARKRSRFHLKARGRVPRCDLAAR